MTDLKVKAKLLTLQQQLNHRIEAIKQDFAKGRSADFAEQTTEKENDEVLMQLQADAETELREVNKALVRLEQGTFGECEQCAEVIPQARLDALPYTSFCVHCAEQHH